MYTKFDELEMLELFFSESQTTLEEVERGEYLFKRDINQFQFGVFMDIYEYKVVMDLSVSGIQTFGAILGNITQLKKNGNKLEIYTKDELRLVVLFDEDKSISVELPDEITDFSLVEND
ncbi:hypothetical protein EQG49_04190 [Periweissella cryptocerci]|uniref:Uncharacterized protein n=1 Tax=Periweissella cryptocerci TaxID=2506420 RepID=A0A4P6YSV8_9LACO|nr:hypothetical protein [Periweissella cryptocerci]QBO35717.1 hypothetical protein EQG49_04190 [Periweissella cryptocerci]